LLQESEGPRLIIVNAGRANVFTGQDGEDFARQTAEVSSGLLGGVPASVLLASTGIIGQCPEAAPIMAGLESLSRSMTADGWAQGAEAIRTTDTFAKLATAETQIDGVPVRINGIAKGSGMIMPDMATMLGFIATDANIAQSARSKSFGMARARLSLSRSILNRLEPHKRPKLLRALLPIPRWLKRLSQVRMQIGDA